MMSSLKVFVFYHMKIIQNRKYTSKFTYLHLIFNFGKQNDPCML